MSIGIAIVVWYGTLVIFGFAGYKLLRHIGLDHSYAWAAGRAAGLLVTAVFAWWLLTVGYTGWLKAGNIALTIAIIGLLLFPNHRRPPFKRLVIAECVFLAGFLLVLFIRLPHPEISGTEKFMDMGLLTMLLSNGTFPPPDLWLSGESTPYYYIGSLLWAPPMQMSGVPFEYGYNLIVATLGGMVASLAWSIGSYLTGTRRGGFVASFFCLAAGTLDGFRQWLINVPIADIDIWSSSRQAVGLITEFPLFSLWLGDLHPHLTSIPLLLGAVLLAIHIQQKGSNKLALGLYSLFSGASIAANPWNLPAVAGVMLLFFLASRKTNLSSSGAPTFSVLQGTVVLILSWLLFTPFWLNYDAPSFLSLQWAPSGTSLPDLLLYGGIFFLPLLGFSYKFFCHQFGEHESGRAYTLTLFALSSLIAVLSGRPSLIFLLVLIIPVTFEAFYHTEKRWRANCILSTLGIGMFLTTELFNVDDIYGAEFVRMNTVFKFYFLGWFLLALAFPMNLRRWLVKDAGRKIALGVLLLFSVPHTTHTLDRAISLPGGMDGFRFLTPGDRAAVDFLARQSKPGTLLEAIGDSYSDYARISSASGVPSFLGWPGHEQVWRGNDILPELNRRRSVAESLYSSTDLTRIQQVLANEHIDWIIIGSLEKARYRADDLATLSQAGNTVFSHEGTRIIRWKSSER